MMIFYTNPPASAPGLGARTRDGKIHLQTLKGIKSEDPAVRFSEGD